MVKAAPEQVESVPQAAGRAGGYETAEGPPVKSPDAVCQPDQFGTRFANFAVGCLGASSPKKAGDKLGLMGAVSEEELVYTLRHLETLSRQRACKLAGVGVGNAASVPGGASCSAQFEKALRDALAASGDEQAVAGGEGDDIASHLFRLLPKDQRGNADVLHVFGMEPALDQGQKVQSPSAKEADVGFTFCSEYMEAAKDLPSAGWPERLSAERYLLEIEDPAEAGWEAAAGAINAIRSSLVHVGSTDVDTTDPRVSEESLIAAIARCCGSRRPALSKGALRALVELAEASSAVSRLSGKAWGDAAEATLGGCLSALRTTKTAGKIAEAAIAAVVERISSDASPAVAGTALESCLTIAVAAKPPQATVVAAALRALLSVLPRLAGEAGALKAAAGLCEEVLKARALSTAYSEARAMQRELKKLSESGSSGSVQ